ncbi:hypothetical protein SLEP1_g53304 [Rubroshorea leprosula]|uniref:Uncharacterized protein n=1 Tax=Rubroshorea leprosula TaxID=152421 RepID=A0AAV5MBU9_9ROSI|nr:hypothetical protein SLEP1_g53304 [Rubroshorea leprosula]
MTASGFTEMVQLLLNNANHANYVKMLLESVEMEADTDT